MDCGGGRDPVLTSDPHPHPSPSCLKYTTFHFSLSLLSLPHSVTGMDVDRIWKARNAKVTLGDYRCVGVGFERKGGFGLKVIQPPNLIGLSY